MTLSKAALNVFTRIECPEREEISNQYVCTPKKKDNITITMTNNMGNELKIWKMYFTTQTQLNQNERRALPKRQRSYRKSRHLERNHLVLQRAKN